MVFSIDYGIWAIGRVADRRPFHHGAIHMAQQIFRWLSMSSASLTVCLLAACGPVQSNPVQPNPNSSEGPSPQAPAASPIASTIAAPAATGIAPGDYCYELESKTLSAQARVTVGQNNTVSGEFQGTVHNDAAAYYTSYQQTFQGPLIGNQAQLDIKTKIEYDHQTSTETWTITPDRLKTERESLQKLDCAKFGQNVSELVPDNTVPAPMPANPDTERVNFAPRATSADLQGAVIRSERKIYVLNAGSNQTMLVDITSLEDNAVIEIISPDGQVLASDVKVFNGKLPVTGDYQIIVSGTRGNATYAMTVEIP